VAEDILNKARATNSPIILTDAEGQIRELTTEALEDFLKNFS